MTADVIIATRNRPEPLRRCLASILLQTRQPTAIFIVDSSTNQETAEVAAEFQSKGLPLVYTHTTDASAARQRNQGIALSSSEILMFFDDDIVLEPPVVAEMMNCLERNSSGDLAGVSATFSNSYFTKPSLLNRIALFPATLDLSGNFSGRLIGPAINFMASDGPESFVYTEWLPSGCVAYRRSVILSTKFDASFDGYSFAEDVHLSSRIAKDHKLGVSRLARVFHEDLGQHTHRDWAALGRSMVRNRSKIARDVLGRSGALTVFRLFWFEVVYGSLALLYSKKNGKNYSLVRRLMLGKIQAFLGRGGG